MKKLGYEIVVETTYRVLFVSEDGNKEDRRYDSSGNPIVSGDIEDIVVWQGNITKGMSIRDVEMASEKHIEALFVESCYEDFCGREMGKHINKMLMENGDIIKSDDDIKVDYETDFDRMWANKRSSEGYRDGFGSYFCRRYSISYKDPKDRRRWKQMRDYLSPCLIEFQEVWMKEYNREWKLTGLGI